MTYNMLHMYNNDLSGFLPPCLANLTSLQQLDLSSNHFKIPMSLSPLYNLTKLKSFDGSGNEIFVKEDDHNLSPKFRLESLYLSGIGQGVGAFPKFLYHQFNLQSLDLTDIQIKGEFPRDGSPREGMGDRCHHAVFSNALYYLPDNRFHEVGP